MLSYRQMKALKYYIGDVSGSAPFWSNGKAYVVLNSLFFPGIGTESARAAEGKFLDPEILADADRLESLLRDLMSAFTSCTVSAPVTTFRVERMSDFSLCRSKSSTVSFTSTSTAGYLASYSDRKGIALLEFPLRPGIPCVDVAHELPYYAKPEEAEVLLPPGLHLDIREELLCEEHLRITDSEGHPPEIRCIAEPSEVITLPSAPAKLLPEGAEAGMRVFKALNEGERPAEDDKEAFICWKSAFISRLFAP